jgi:hypothetical protein
VEPERAGIARMLAAAERNIADARLAALSAENRFDAAYKAILQCAMLALRANGFRTLTSQAGHHQTALQTLPLTIGLAKDRMILLDLMRFIQARLEEQGARVADELPFNTPSSVVDSRSVRRRAYVPTRMSGEISGGTSKSGAFYSTSSPGRSPCRTTKSSFSTPGKTASGTASSRCRSILR